MELEEAQVLENDHRPLMKPNERKEIKTDRSHIQITP